MTAVNDVIAGDLQRPPPPGLDGLLASLRARYGNHLRAVLLYGSCRRDVDVHDGLVDLLVLVESYRGVHGWFGPALLNRLLPPNVYFLQVDQAGKTVRCKYALATLGQFERRCRSRSDHYFWARFSQPCRLLYTAGEDNMAAAVTESRAAAARTFCRRIAPLVRTPVSAPAFWQKALATTYRCELRPEPPDNARRLIAADPEFWQALTRALATEPGNRLRADGDRYIGTSGPWRSHLTGLSWLARQVTGKCFNLARLFKAAGTFSNGIDYITWKVERHSGVRIEPTARMRRYPRLTAWGLAWRMWRQGGFR